MFGPIQTYDVYIVVHFLYYMSKTPVTVRSPHRGQPGLKQDAEKGRDTIDIEKGKGDTKVRKEEKKNMSFGGDGKSSFEKGTVCLMLRLSDIVVQITRYVIPYTVLNEIIKISFSM